MDIFKEIEQNVPDLEKAQLTCSYVMSKGEAQEKVVKLEKKLGGIAVYYELSGKKLTIYYSPEMKEKWGAIRKERKFALL